MKFTSCIWFSSIYPTACQKRLDSGYYRYYLFCWSRPIKWRLAGDAAINNKDFLQRASSSNYCNQILSLRKANGGLIVSVKRATPSSRTCMLNLFSGSGTFLEANPTWPQQFLGKDNFDFSVWNALPWSVFWWNNYLCLHYFISIFLRDEYLGDILMIQISYVYKEFR